jgi:putative MATE family efflux protein
MVSQRFRTLRKYVVPAMLTNTCVFLFTIVDGLFVGNGVGQNALGAVNLAMPFVMIAMALYNLAAIGGASSMAIQIGKNDKIAANNVFLHSLSLNFIISVLVTLIGTCATTSLCSILGANDTYLNMVKDYVFWWSVFAIPNAMSIHLQAFCRNDGSPSLVAAATVSSTLTNIFLDWLFVFPLHMGITGAAIATGISQTLGFAIVLSHFIMKKGCLRIKPFQPNGALYRQIIFTGMPEMIAQFANPVTTVCLNRMLLLTIGDIGVNVFAVISYVSSFSMSILFGASEGLQPLFGQSYGAGKNDDLKYYFKSGLKISLIGSVICTLLSIVLASPIASLFGAKELVLTMTVSCMPKYSWAFIVAGVNTLISAYLYSTEKTSGAILLNLLRSFIINTAVIIGLSNIFGESIVWMTYGISETITMIIAMVILYKANAA